MSLAGSTISMINSGLLGFIATRQEITSLDAEAICEPPFLDERLGITDDVRQVE